MCLRYSSLFGLLGCALACAPLTPVYPARPPNTPGPPVAEPMPARVTLHATLSAAALRAELEQALPNQGEGSLPILGFERKYTWLREPLTLSFDKDKVEVAFRIVADCDLPLTHLQFPLEFRISTTPIVTADYKARLQGTEVRVSSADSRLRLANWTAGAMDKLQKVVEGKLQEFTYDLKPQLNELYQRVAKPIQLPLGDASGCAVLHVLGVEAGPTVFADGIEKDLALVVAPTVTLPCAESAEPAALPPLANVTTLQSGPFTLTVPIAARYEELTRAMSLAFTNGKLYFSKEYPELFLEKPEVYAAKDQVVLKLHVFGKVRKFFFDSLIDGDIFFTGHPAIEDNELRVPDLEPTLDTRSLLLKLKATFDGNSIRDDARKALRLDLSERLKAVREKLTLDLQFNDGQGCLKTDASKIEVTRMFAHGSYLRLYVELTGRAAAYLPCP